MDQNEKQESGNHEGEEHEGEEQGEGDFDFGIHLDDLTEQDNPSRAIADDESEPEEIPELIEIDVSQVMDEDGQEEEPSVHAAITEIRDHLAELTLAFDSKIKYDAHKEKVIDELHHALQEHRDGLLKKYLQRIFTDVIKIVDDVRKLARHYRGEPATEENHAKLLQYLEDVASDLEDVFAWEGIVSFRTESETLDPARQRVVKKIETDEPARDKVIAKRHRPGYEWDGKVIRPEIVSIYICSKQPAAEDKEI
jgi:molecular chaperone GrpE (heat shock protein)